MRINFAIMANPYFYIIISMVMVIISKVVFKIDYMNCFFIYKKHVDNFRNENGKILLVPFSVHFIMPMLLAIGTYRIKSIDSEIVEGIIVIFSILIGMLFTLLVLTIDMSSKVELRSREEGSRINRIKELSKESFYTIMFEILLAIGVLLLSFVNMFTNSVNDIVSFIIYGLVYLFFVNLFMVLKRIFIIVEDDFNVKIKGR